MQCQILPLFHKQYKAIGKENLVVNQRSLRAFFHAPLHLFKGFFGWAYFWGSLQGLVIRRNFAFHIGFGWSIKTAKNTKITA